MITRFALFEGHVKPSDQDKFREAVKTRLVPLWTKFPGATNVRVMFGDDRDEGAPEFPLILAITYPDEDAMAQALGSPYRSQSRDVTGEIVDEFFEGRIHHHVTQLNEYQAG